VPCRGPSRKIMQAGPMIVAITGPYILLCGTLLIVIRRKPDRKSALVHKEEL